MLLSVLPTIDYSTFIYDKQLHLFGWLVIPFLFNIRKFKLRCVVVFVLCMLTEGVQFLLPYRHFEFEDMVYNFIGASVWLVIILVISKIELTK